MASQTENLGLNIWLETDFVDFNEINANFEKIDKLVVCVESGTKTATYTGGSDTVATWRYRKYSDGTIDMWAKMEFTNLKCNGGTEAPYYSGTSTVNFPFTMANVYNVHMDLASNTIGWVSNITGQSVIDKVMFRVMAMSKEETTEYKQIFIQVKGVLA